MDNTKLYLKLDGIHKTSQPLIIGEDTLSIDGQLTFHVGF